MFPGQEIAQTTIIEKESFLSWKVRLIFLSSICGHMSLHLQEEAFSIWSDWALCYRPDSEERKTLESVRDERWLVSILHHDYKDTEALWKFLFEGGELL